MSRIEDLKAKGWKNLTKEERDEYKTLSPQETEISESVPKKDDLLSLSREDLKKMIAQAVQQSTSELRQERDQLVQEKVGEWKELKEPKKRSQKAKMRLYRENSDAPLGLVIDWKHFKFDYNEETRKHDKDIYKITVLYDDEEKKEYFMTLLEFCQLNDFETVEIVSQDRKKLVKNHGEVFVTSKSGGYNLYKLSENGYKAVPSEFSVPLEEIRDEVFATIKRPNGKTLILNINRLNA